MPNQHTKDNITKPELREIMVEAVRNTLPDVTRKQIAEVLGIERESVHRIENRIQVKPLKDKKIFVNTAHKVIMENMKRKPSIVKKVKITKDGDVIEYEEEERPTFSNSLDAASQVLQRAEPIHQEGIQQQVSFTKIDISITQRPQDVVLGTDNEDIIEIDNQQLK